MADATFAAIRSGDLAALRQLLGEHPGLAGAPLGDRYGTRTPLHVVTDWPGYFPNGPEVVRVLVAAGADPDTCNPGETPLHWAASSDDSDVAEALIDSGADIEAPDGSIGTPLSNAVGYGCWHVARLLVARGARVELPWQAAALGLQARLEELLAESTDPQAPSQALWHACAGAQRRVAEYLLGQGADLQWVPDYADGAALDAARGNGTRRDNVISWLLAVGARSSAPEEHKE